MNLIKMIKNLAPEWKLIGAYIFDIFLACVAISITVKSCRKVEVPTVSGGMTSAEALLIIERDSLIAETRAKDYKINRLEDSIVKTTKLNQSLRKDLTSLKALTKKALEGTDSLEMITALNNEVVVYGEIVHNYEDMIVVYQQSIALRNDYINNLKEVIALDSNRFIIKENQLRHVTAMLQIEQDQHSKTKRKLFRNKQVNRVLVPVAAIAGTAAIVPPYTPVAIVGGVLYYIIAKPKK